MGRLDGKVALVTGGNTGIGRSVCLAFADEGADGPVNKECEVIYALRIEIDLQVHRRQEAERVPSGRMVAAMKTSPLLLTR